MEKDLKKLIEDHISEDATDAPNAWHFPLKFPRDVERIMDNMSEILENMDKRTDNYKKLGSIHKHFVDNHKKVKASDLEKKKMKAFSFLSSILGR